MVFICFKSGFMEAFCHHATYCMSHIFVGFDWWCDTCCVTNVCSLQPFVVLHVSTLVYNVKCVWTIWALSLFVSSKDILWRKKRLHFNRTSSLEHFVVILFYNSELINLLDYFDIKPSSELMQHQYLLFLRAQHIISMRTVTLIQEAGCIWDQQVVQIRSYNRIKPR